VLYNYGNLIYQRGDPARAEPLFDEALELRRKLGCPEDEFTGELLGRQGNLLESKGDDAGAELRYREALAVKQKLFSETNPRVKLSLGDLARVLWKQRQYDAAGEMYRSVVSIIRNQPDPDAVELGLFLHHLAEVLREAGKAADALPHAREAVSLYRQHPEHPEFHEHKHAVEVLVKTLREVGENDEAVRVSREFVEDCQRFWLAEELRLATALAGLGRLQVEVGKHFDAEPALRECAVIREKVLKPDSKDYWHLLTARSWLGDALAGQVSGLIESDAAAALAKLSEAEPLLVESARGLLHDPERIPERWRATRLREAVHRVARLYETWETAAPGTGKAEQAAMWRAEMERLTASRPIGSGSRPAPASRPTSRPR
jgi:tetratricopeptide (TPR) repeat protein